MNTMPQSKRAYRMTARAESSQHTADRIQDATIALFRARPFEDVSLQAVADASGVTLQTVLRHFGSKEGLFSAASRAYAAKVFASRRPPSPKDTAAIVAAVVDSFEDMGDLNWRGVTQEERFPIIKQIFDMARTHHRQWVETAFADHLAHSRGAERERRVVLLFAATDFYVWKLYRRDLGLSRAQTTARMLDLVEALLQDFRRLK